MWARAATVDGNGEWNKNFPAIYKQSHGKVSSEVLTDGRGLLTVRAVKSWLIRIGIAALLVLGVAAFHHSRVNRPQRVVAATQKQQLILGNGAEVGTLDPQLATGQPEHFIFSALFEGLVTAAADNPDANAPGAASSWDTEDFIHWTFHLRPEGKWSDGTPLTAQDFAWSYQRIL